ncbi:uncharacterized protein METZ01_LOCUS407334 [marine metagenome]|uniref:Uncharacterized protein n=1 Tax=marine metagenome TaxID=408172 RepID=A0A382W7H6_9ZZZZ
MKHRVGNRYFSSTAFIDLLFNIIVGVAFLFLIAFILINPVSKKHDVESKADFLIILEWDSKSNDDIDLWIRDPLDNVMSFRSKDIGFMHLDRDDLGSRNDKVKLPDGTIKYINLNREIAALRGTLEGWYVVNVHVYRKNRMIDPEDGVSKFIPTTTSVELIQVNPYRIKIMTELILEKQGQEFTLFAFRLNDTGEVMETKKEDISFVSLLNFTAGDDRTYTEGNTFGDGW